MGGPDGRHLPREAGGVEVGLLMHGTPEQVYALAEMLPIVPDGPRADQPVQ